MRGLSLFSALMVLFGMLAAVEAFAFGGKPQSNPAPAPPAAPAPPPLPQQNPSPIPAPTPVPGFSTACLNKIGGSWNFGQSPSACNVSNQQSPAFAAAQYAPVVFRDADSAARAHYMSEMYPAIREMGTYYIKRRNPSVSAAELQGFIHGLYALAHQETFWTHYRLGVDKILRFMRGDNLHGYGLMQVDDRSHSAAIRQGKGVDLAENMVYGLDIFYDNWVRAAKSSCLSSPTDFRSRARAAWSAYNGGQGSICRWTNPSSPHVDKDKSYNSKYSNQAWLPYVLDPMAPAKIDMKCLAEGVRPCPAPKAGQ